MALPDEQLILGRGAENLQNDSYCHLPRVQGVYLLGAAMYIPGSEPEIFDSQDPVTLTCCGKIQRVPAASIRFKLGSVTQLGASDWP
jgi:hypothetical protein